MQTFSQFYNKSKSKPRGLVALPKIESQEFSVDVSLLDVMSIEDFLSHLKNKTDNSWKDLWRETCIIADQLKASRELLSIGSNLLSHKTNRSILTRLINVTKVLLSAERVAVLEVDETGQELVVTFSLDERLIGVRSPVSSGIEGDVFSRKMTANVTDVNLDPRFIPALELKGGIRTKNLVCAPILADGVSVGVILAVNKTSSIPRDFAALSFSPNEALLLGFIAANAGLALRHGSLLQSISNTEFDVTVGSQLSKQMVKLENDVQFQKLVNLLHIYGKIDAERVSIFIYSPVSKSLICVVSPDIKGFAMPPDKGLAGLSFTAGRTINIPDVRNDERHFKDVDQTFGFNTKSILCTPILTTEGVPLGVIQAVNKKSGPSFTPADEQQLTDISNSMVALLSEKHDAPVFPSLEHQNSIHNNSNNLPVGLTKALMKLGQAVCVSDLIREGEGLVASHSSFNFFRIYLVHQDKLSRVIAGTLSLPDASGCDILDPTEQYSISSLPIIIKQVLQFSSITEYNESTCPSPLLGNIRLQHGYVVPLQTKVYPYSPGNCIMILGHTSEDLSCNEKHKLELDLISSTVTSAILTLSQKLSYEDCARQLRHQYHILNSTLGTLQDFVIILNGEGKLLGCNKAVEDLLGLNQLPLDSWSISESRKRNSASGRSSPTPAVDPNTGFIREGMHYSQWLTNGNSPELCRDIQNALLRGESRALESARLTSNKYPEGISVDYQVTAVGNPDNVGQAYNLLSPQRSGTESVKGLPDIPEGECASATSNGLVVVVSIHINKRKTMELDEAVPSVGSSDNCNTIELKSASFGVDSAASILAAIRNNYVLDSESETQIKQLTNSLVQTSRRMSIRQSSFSAINFAIQAANIMLVNPIISLPDNIFEWTFDVLKIKDGLVLCNIIGKFFETLFDLDRLGVESVTLARYIAEVGRHYHDRPFHNLQHATCVTHFCFMLIRATGCVESLKEHQVFAILLSAVVHDIDHPGNTNLFEINSQSELAIRYNDQSVLENHHCSTAFRLMRKPNMQVLNSVPKNISTDIRKVIIQCVMATDMAVHFELIDETKKRAINGWNFEEVKDQSLMGKIILHAADLSNPVRPFHMTKEWAQRISVEFNDQVEREQALDMPVLGFMMTPDEKAFCKNETGFASFVVAPMWRTLALCFPELTFLVKQLDDNLVTWKGVLEKIVAEEAAAASQQASISPKGK